MVESIAKHSEIGAVLTIDVSTFNRHESILKLLQRTFCIRCSFVFLLAPSLPSFKKLDLMRLSFGVIGRKVVLHFGIKMPLESTLTMKLLCLDHHFVVFVFHFHRLL